VAQLLPLSPLVIVHLEKDGVSQVNRREWYVVYSKPRRESYAQFQLCARGLEVFFPQLLLPHASPTKTRVIPFFPNYLFVRLDLASTEYYQAAWCPGVRRIVSFNGHPAAIDEKIIQLLINESSAHGVITARSTLKRGQGVQLTAGPFAGLVGIIEEPPNAKGRVKILLQLLNREAKVEVPVQCIEASWTAALSGLSATA
jgi:transcriptional antiterminator RfaH